MGLANVVLFLTASLACASGATIYGEEQEGTVLLVNKLVDRLQFKTRVSFNKDLKFDITIDMVKVDIMRMMVNNPIVEGGPSKKYVVLELQPEYLASYLAGVSIYGRKTKGKKSRIESDDIIFTTIR